jgi:hypothetical protein
MTTQEIASPLPICHLTEAERNPYAWLFVHPMDHDVKPVNLPVGVVCHVCYHPISDRDLIFAEEEGWIHGRCRVISQLSREDAYRLRYNRQRRKR